MSNRIDVAKKQIERRVLEAARHVCATIPGGEVQDFEKPDFKIATAEGFVGVEVTAVMPSPVSDVFSSPLAEKSFHEQVVQIAEEHYQHSPGAAPVQVTVWFWEIESGRYDKRAMARSLVEFVRSNRSQALPVEHFSRRPDFPEGFGVISIRAESGPWLGLETVSLNLDQIQQQVAARIRAKNALLSTYCANLPDSSIWLLLFSGAEISTGVPIAQSLTELRFPFDFDRVLFFSSCDNRVVELCKA